MTSLPITCEDCGRRHWSVGALMTCKCEGVDRYGHKKSEDG